MIETTRVNATDYESTAGQLMMDDNNTNISVPTKSNEELSNQIVKDTSHEISVKMADSTEQSDVHHSGTVEKFSNNLVNDVSSFLDHSGDEDGEIIFDIHGSSTECEGSESTADTCSQSTSDCSPFVSPVRVKNILRSDAKEETVSELKTKETDVVTSNVSAVHSRQKVESDSRPVKTASSIFHELVAISSDKTKTGHLKRSAISPEKIIVRSQTEGTDTAADGSECSFRRSAQSGHNSQDNKNQTIHSKKNCLPSNASKGSLEMDNNAGTIKMISSSEDNHEAKSGEEDCDWWVYEVQGESDEEECRGDNPSNPLNRDDLANQDDTATPVILNVRSLPNETSFKKINNIDQQDVKLSVESSDIINKEVHEYGTFSDSPLNNKDNRDSPLKGSEVLKALAMIAREDGFNKEDSGKAGSTGAEKREVNQIDRITPQQYKDVSSIPKIPTLKKMISTSSTWYPETSLVQASTFQSPCIVSQSSVLMVSNSQTVEYMKATEKTVLCGNNERKLSFYAPCTVAAVSSKSPTFVNVSKINDTAVMKIVASSPMTGFRDIAPKGSLKYSSQPVSSFLHNNTGTITCIDRPVSSVPKIAVRSSNIRNVATADDQNAAKLHNVMMTEDKNVTDRLAIITPGFHSTDEENTEASTNNKNTTVPNSSQHIQVLSTSQMADSRKQVPHLKPVLNPLNKTIPMETSVKEVSVLKKQIVLQAKGLDLTTINIDSVQTASIVELIGRRNPLPTMSVKNKKDLERKVFVCYECGDSFEFSRSYHEHKARKCMIIRYQCDVCKRKIMFPNKCSFLSHLRNHKTKNSAVTINQVINVRSDALSILPLPYRRINESKPSGRAESTPADRAESTQTDQPHFECQECGMLFATKDELCDHMQQRQIFNEKSTDQIKELKTSLQCSQCAMQLWSACALKAHRRIHNKFEPYVCPECGDLLKSDLGFKKHLIKDCFHLSRCMSTNCLIVGCLQTFASGDRCVEHLPEHTYLFCKLCNRLFPKELQFKKHLIAKHYEIYKDGKEEHYYAFRCPVTTCSTLCETREDLRYHFSDHFNKIKADDMRPGFSCFHCSYLFVNQQQLKAHYEKHCATSNTLIARTKCLHCRACFWRREPMIHHYFYAHCKLISDMLFCMRCKGFFLTPMHKRYHVCKPPIMSKEKVVLKDGEKVYEEFDSEGKLIIKKSHEDTTPLDKEWDSNAVGMEVDENDDQSERKSCKSDECTNFDKETGNSSNTAPEKSQNAEVIIKKEIFSPDDGDYGNEISADKTEVAMEGKMYKVIKYSLPKSHNMMPISASSKYPTGYSMQNCLHCKWPESRLMTERSFKNHIRSHQMEGILMCWNCQKIFSTHEAMKNHQVICRQLKQYWAKLESEKMSTSKAVSSTNQRNSGKASTEQATNKAYVKAIDKARINAAKDIQTPIVKIERPDSVENIQDFGNSCEDSQSWDNHSDAADQSTIRGKKIALAPFWKSIPSEEDDDDECEPAAVQPMIHECDECGELFEGKLELQCHERIHKNVLFPCHLCTFTYTSNDDLQQHIKSTHSKTKELYQCLNCKKKNIVKYFVSKTKIERHVSSKHRISEADRSSCYCIVDVPNDSVGLKRSCEESDTQEEAPPRKLRIIGDENYNCSKCMFSTCDRSEFAAHITEHKDGDAKQCPECGLSFMALAGLRNHLFVVHKVRDLESYCQKNNLLEAAFITEEQLPVAMATSANLNSEASEKAESTNLNLFQCSVCYNCYTDENTLTRHMRTHGMAFIKSRRQQMAMKINKDEKKESDEKLQTDSFESMEISIKKEVISSPDM